MHRHGYGPASSLVASHEAAYLEHCRRYNAAELAGLPDRGRLEAGARADVVRVRVHETLPVVRQVWSGGERVI